MPTIQDIRQQYPQYNDMTDQQLAGALHNKYYSDLPQEQFYQKIGLSNPQSEGSAAQQQTNPSFVPRVGADLLAGYAKFGNGLINAPHNIANYISPSLGAKVPGYLPNFDYGKALGVNAPNMGDKLLQGAAQFAPYMLMPGGALAQGAAFGATQSQNPVTGALTGATVGKLGEVAPSAIAAIPSGIGKLTSAIQPQKYAKQILNTLGGGNTLEGNAQSLAQDIKGAFNNRVQQGQALYQPVFDTLGDQPIYQGANQAAYNSLDDGIINSYDRNLTKLHQQFTENPTLQNAHNLQSQFGTAIRKLQSTDAKGNLSVADRNTMQGYQEAQNALRGDMNDFLNNQNPQLANQYNLATANWAQNVTPYLENPKIAQIAKGEMTNPNNISNLFKSPEPELQQIVDDIGPSANHKILFSELGKTQANLTPEGLLKASNQLDNKGLASYMTPQLSDALEQLNSKINNRDLTQTALGGVVGAHLFGPFGAALGAAAPKLINMSKPALSRATQILPSINGAMLSKALGANAVKPIASAVYPYATGALTAALVNSQGGPP